MKSRRRVTAEWRAHKWIADFRAIGGEFELKDGQLRYDFRAIPPDSRGKAAKLILFPIAYGYAFKVAEQLLRAETAA